MSADPLRPDLTGFRRRLAELEALLADPATFADNRRAAALGAELRFTSKAVKADDVLAGLEKELADARTMGAESDPELRAMAAEEVARLAPAVEKAREQLFRSIINIKPIFCLGKIYFCVSLTSFVLVVSYYCCNFSTCL